MKRIKLIAGILCAISLIAFSGCGHITDDDDDKNYDKTRVFNITTSDTTSTSLTSKPKWNVFFPPVLNWDFTVYKGKVGAYDFNESTAANEFFSNSLNYDYENTSWAATSKLYVDNSSYVYLSPDDTRGYAYRIKSQKSGADDIVSDLIYPEDIIKIECKLFDYIDDMFLWDIEFSKKPDALYLVSGFSNTINYKSAWKFTAYFESSSCDYSLKEELEPSETKYRCANPYRYTAIFAKYGDYYVRVTPAWNISK